MNQQNYGIYEYIYNVYEKKIKYEQIHLNLVS